MNHFTPDLLARFGSPDDEIADAASAEWEQVQARYTEHLQAIYPELPAGARAFLDEHDLHDARVIAVARGVGGRTLTLLMQLDTTPKRGIQLTYRLASPPRFTHYPWHDDEPRGQFWLYDEIDVFRTDPYPAFTHDILFTGGLEMRLVFLDLQVTPYPELAPDSVEALEAAEAMGG